MAAAVAPANVPYLYFVAMPDGHHEFRATYAEHLEAVREARQAAALASRSATPATRSAPTSSSPAKPGTATTAR